MIDVPGRAMIDPLRGADDRPAATSHDRPAGEFPAENAGAPADLGFGVLWKRPAPLGD
jgi:hypothetical protein